MTGFCVPLVLSSIQFLNLEWRGQSYPNPSYCVYSPHLFEGVVGYMVNPRFYKSYLNINPQKDLKGYERKLVLIFVLFGLIIGVVKHGSFLVFVTGLCVPLFLSSSHFLNPSIRSVVRLKVL